MINGAAMHPGLTGKTIILHLSFYQSFDGPAPIPSMANMPLDDITIRTDCDIHELKCPVQ
jgi:hypothetical protein